MNNLTTGQIIGIVLVAIAVVDSFILPRILLRRYEPPTGIPPEEKAELEKKKKTMKLMISVIVAIPAILGLLFFLGVIAVK